MKDDGERDEMGFFIYFIFVKSFVCGVLLAVELVEYMRIAKNINHWTI